MDGYMSIKEIASLLKVHIVTVRRWVVKYKTLPAYRLGKDFRVKKSDFEKFMDSKRVKEEAKK